MPKLSLKIKHASFGAATAIAMTAMAPAAQASMVELAYANGSSAWGSPVWARNVSYTLDNNAKTHGAGLFRLEDTATGASVLAWCIDLLHTLALPAEHSTVTQAADADQLENIDRLFTSAYEDVVDADTAAGFQIALWEIMEDTDAGLDLTDGAFVTTGSGNHYDIAEGFLAGLATAATGDYTLTTYYNADSQNLVEGIKAPPIPAVPVPASALLMLTGLAGFGVMRRRRKAA